MNDPNTADLIPPDAADPSPDTPVAPGDDSHVGPDPFTPPAFDPPIPPAPDDAGPYDESFGTCDHGHPLNAQGRCAELNRGPA
jgi:hypothetical protein